MIVDSQTASKHKTEDLGDKLIISMPWRKNLFSIFVFGLVNLLWLGFGCMILFSFLITSSYDPSPTSDLTFYLTLIVGWIAAGMFLMYTLGYPLVWRLFGREEIQINNQSIKISNVVLGFRRSKEYLANQIIRLRPTRSDYQPQDKINQGLVAFNYDPQATDQYITFATGIDDTEAKQIIAEIQHKYPQYKEQM